MPHPLEMPCCLNLGEQGIFTLVHSANHLCVCVFYGRRSYDNKTCCSSEPKVGIPIEM